MHAAKQGCPNPEATTELSKYDKDWADCYGT